MTNLVNKARQEFYIQFIEEHRSNQKMLFNAANKLLGERKQLRFPDHTNKTVLANDVGALAQNRAHLHRHRL